jgi:translocator protein
MTMKDWQKIILFLAIPLFIGFFGSLFMSELSMIWYASLDKAFFNPPNWLFGPAWTLLYILMGYSGYLIWQSKKSKLQKTTKELYVSQLIINAAWTPIFFGNTSLVGGLITIILLDLAVIFTIIYSYKINKKASYLLIPYLLWILFATILNISLLVLN